MADNVISNLSITVTSNADEVARAFSRLASSARRLQDAAGGAASGMSKAADGIKEVSGSMNSAASSAKDMGTATKEAGEQAGKAQMNMRGLGNDAKDAGDKAKKGASGIAVFWQSLRRIAFYRFIRSIIREITDAFKTGITNLYRWSDAVNGHFAASMDRLATSSQYLKNSLGAMVSPLIETLIPVLDVIIDKIVDVINFFNMLVSAISGSDTYTVARKIAAVWEDSADRTSATAHRAAAELKKTILSFDEINKLDKPASNYSGGGSAAQQTQPGYADMFEEKPLTGIFRRISDITRGWPDWLKALLSVGVPALAIFGIPALLKSIWGWLKNLFGLKAPDWFNWLFGPKGDNGGSINLPDEITIPDVDITTNLEKGDWSALDDLNGTPVYLDPRLDNKPEVLLNRFQDEWTESKNRIVYLVPKLDNKAEVLLNRFQDAWTESKNRIVYLIPKLDNKPEVLLNRFRDAWNNLESRSLYFVPKLDNSARVLFNKFKEAWMNLPPDLEVLVKVGLIHWGWDNIKDWIGTAVTVHVALKKWGWTTLSKWIGSFVVVKVGLSKLDWTTIDDFVGTSVTVDISLAKYGWTTLGKWTEADNGLTVNIGLRHWGWNNIADYIGTAVTVSVGLRRWGWSNIQDWVGSNVTVYVRLRASGGSISYSGSRQSFGSATGGGGGSRGGVVGRGRRALGGVYANGTWSGIPQYAGGTMNAHGSLFLAGEAGPEVVGHVGGRTEVLNKSQLASAMYSAVQAAMAPASANFANAAQSMGHIEGGLDFEMLADMIREGIEQAMGRQTELDRQRNEYLRQINEKEFTAEVTTAGIQRAMARTNRRAGIAVTSAGV